jgi:aminoglycoside/choline kinase family phosphotransferase
MTDLDMNRLTEIARPILGTEISVQAMPGGASTRKYFRLTSSSAPKKSLVAMFVPDGDKPEEISKSDVNASRRWPFLEVADLLKERGVDVPAILHEDAPHGWLLLEDLGDLTLAVFLEKNPQKKSALYTQAVVDLARAQKVLSDLPASSVVASRSFDVDLLTWEIDHFREWGVEARGIAISQSQRAQFDALAQRFASRVSKMPYGFVHRDYQSRNLMVRVANQSEQPENKLVWIDFQDALKGPRVYDLVALLSDSYQEFDRPFIEARLDEFARAAGLENERANIGTEFDVVTVQRKLKDAGRFVFIDRVKKNPSFLRFVEPTILKVKRALERLSPHDEDAKAMSALLDDLRV